MDCRVCEQLVLPVSWLLSDSGLINTVDSRKLLTSQLESKMFGVAGGGVLWFDQISPTKFRCLEKTHRRSREDCGRVLDEGLIRF